MNPPLIKSIIFVLALATLVFADFRQVDSAKAATQCQGGSFLSTTVLGKTPDKAREKAKAEIARSIISNIKSETSMTDYSEEKDGVLKESNKFIETTKIESELTLLGFHEAETPKRQKNGEYELKAYVCNKDAAKGFLERQRLIADSLELVSGTVLNTKHPKHKNEAWRKTQMLWGEFIRTQSLLEVLGVESELFASARKSYDRAREDYRNYCRNAKVFWQDAGNECSETIFAMLSKKIKMEKSKCSGGLKLSLGCSDKCKSSSFGVECSYEPSIAIESCGEEKYSMLKAKEAVTGSHEYNKGIAKENLIENLSKASFFNEWEREIMEWIPKCVE